VTPTTAQRPTPTPPANLAPPRPHNPLPRLLLWIALALLLLPGQILWLFTLRGHRLLASDQALIYGQLTLGLAAAALLALLKTTRPDSIRLPARASSVIVIGGTLLLQLFALLWLAPVLSDDLFRYRLDGRMWLSRTSPYATPPERFLNDHPPDPADALVPYRDWRTVYPPVSQAFFTLARWIDQRLFSPPASPPNLEFTTAWRTRATQPEVLRRTRVTRALFALLVVAAVAVLVSILRANGESPWWAVVLGWNPLVTLEIGGMGHQDALGALFLALTILAARRRHFRAAAAALALACGVKPVAALLLPFLWRQAHEEHSFRAGRRMLLVFAATLALAFSPLAYQHGLAGWRQTLLHFGHRWEANGFFYESFRALFGVGDEGRQMERAKDAARLLAFLATLSIGLFLWQSRARLAEAGYWLFLVLLLCAPVAYPWYLIWILTMIPLLRGPQGYAGLVWAATAAMSYTLWRDADWIWSVRPNWLAAEYLPVLIAMALEALRLARQVPLQRTLTTPRA
jgi:hypothetical protein